MNVLPIFEEILSVELNKVPARKKVGVSANAAYSGSWTEPEVYGHYRFGVEVGCNVTGPPEAVNDMRARAVATIAEMVYGPLRDELFTVICDLRAEGGRPYNDPILKRLEGMMNAMAGK